MVGEEEEAPNTPNPHLSQPHSFQILALGILIHGQVTVWEAEAPLQGGFGAPQSTPGAKGAWAWEAKTGKVLRLSPSPRTPPQSLGLSNSHDRALVKRKLKEMAAAAEKERKAQEKAARQREKLRRREQEAKKS